MLPVTALYFTYVEFKQADALLKVMLCIKALLIELVSYVRTMFTTVVLNSLNCLFILS